MELTWITFSLFFRQKFTRNTLHSFGSDEDCRLQLQVEADDFALYFMKDAHEAKISDILFVFHY